MPTQTAKRKDTCTAPHLLGALIQLRPQFGSLPPLLIEGCLCSGGPPLCRLPRRRKAVILGCKRLEVAVGRLQLPQHLPQLPLQIQPTLLLRSALSPSVCSLLFGGKRLLLQAQAAGLKLALCLAQPGSLVLHGCHLLSVRLALLLQQGGLLSAPPLQLLQLLLKGSRPLELGTQLLPRSRQLCLQRLGCLPGLCRLCLHGARRSLGSIHAALCLCLQLPPAPLVSIPLLPHRLHRLLQLHAPPLHGLELLPHPSQPLLRLLRSRPRLCRSSLVALRCGSGGLHFLLRSAGLLCA